MGKKSTPNGVLFCAQGNVRASECVIRRLRRALVNAGKRPRIRVGVGAVRLAAGHNELGRLSAHPRWDFGLSSLHCVSPLRRLPFLLAQKKGSKNCAVVLARDSGPKSP
jgi:hypothetical protein